MIRTINEELCRGCGGCDGACPMDVIVLDPLSRKARVEHGDDCMTCYNCELACPEGAIFVDPFTRAKPRVW